MMETERTRKGKVKKAVWSVEGRFPTCARSAALCFATGVSPQCRQVKTNLKMLEGKKRSVRDQRLSLMMTMYSVLVLEILMTSLSGGLGGCQSLIWSCGSLRGQRSL